MLNVNSCDFHGITMQYRTEESLGNTGVPFFKDFTVLGY